FRLLQPRRGKLDLVEYPEADADSASQASEQAAESGIQFIAPRLIVAVENLIHHGDHPFLTLFRCRSRHSASGKQSGSLAAQPSACSTNSSRFSVSSWRHAW